MDSAERARRWHGLAILRFIACVTVVGLLSVGLVPVMGTIDSVAAIEPALWVSARPDGSQSNGESYSPSISADGQLVAFFGSSSDLVTGDTNGVNDVFLRDRVGGTVARVSVDSAGAQGNNASSLPAISADGTKVAFVSTASNLVAGDTNAVTDVFVRDLAAGTTERVSVSSSGVQGAGLSRGLLSISADGRFVAFESQSSNLVANDTNNVSDAFVRDRLTNTTIRVSVNSSGTGGSGASQAPVISADGSFAAFSSQATNLVSGDTNAAADVFVHDLATGQTDRVSVSSSGGQGNGRSDTGVTISSDGRYVAYGSRASNLVSSDTNGSTDVFLRDRDTGTTERVSLSTTGRQGNSSSQGPSISGDGRYVAFIAFATNLVGGDTNDVQDVLIRDRQTRRTWRASLDSWGGQSDDWTDAPVISTDGEYVAFYGGAALVANDTNGAEDVYARRSTPVGYEVDTRWRFGERRSSGRAADPVDTASGNFYDTSTDLEPRGRSIVSWARSYNSLDMGVGVLGRGWSTLADVSMGELANDEVDFRDADGRASTFTLAEAGGWVRPQEVTGDLERDVDGSLSLHWFDGATWDFDAAGRLAAITEWSGETVTVTRDGGGRATSIVSSLGTSLTFTYDPVATHLVESVTDQDGRTVTYSQAGDFLQQVVSPEGTTTFTPDGGERIAEIVDGSGLVELENSFDPVSGRVTAQSLASGEQTTFTYDIPDRSTTVTDVESGDAVVYVHNEFGRLVSITDPLGNSLAVESYDALGNPTGMTSRLNASTAAAFDASDNVTSVTDPASGTTTFSHDAYNRVQSVTVPNGTPSGNTTTYCYDISVPFDDCTGANGGNRAPTRVTDDLGHAITYTVQDGRVTSAADADGVTTSYEYDNVGRTIAFTDGLGNVTRTAYCADPSGETVHVTSPRGAATADDPNECASPDLDDFVTETRYDLAGRVEWERAADGGLTSNTYDAAGRLATVTDAASAVTTLGYDPATGELASVAKPGPTGSGHATVTTSYSRSFRSIGGVPHEVRTTTAPDGAVSEEIYGPLRRLVETREQTDGASTPDTSDDVYRSTTYTYTADGQVATTTDAAGGVTTSRHDGLGRVTETCDGEGRRTVNTYDAVGRLERTAGPWDDNPATTVCATGSLPVDAPVTTYEYDDLGRQLATVDPTGKRTEIAYTPGGRVATTTDPANLITTNHYDAAGRIDWTDLPGAAGQRRSEFGYDPDGNTTSVTNAEGETTATTYDPAGRVLTVTDAASVTTTQSWSLRGELVGRQIEGQGTEEYHYDPSGALEWVEDGLDHRTTYEYDTTSRRVLRTNALAGEAEWAYFDDGSVRFETDELDRTTTYSYDPAGRVTTVADPSGRATTTTYNATGQPLSIAHLGGDTDTYTYDNAGLTATVTNSAGTSSWTYEADGSPKTETSPTGRTTAWVLDSAGRRGALRYPDGATVNYGYEPATGRLATLTPGETMADSFTAANGALPDTERWTRSLSTGASAAIQGNELALTRPATTGSATAISRAANATDVDISLRYRFQDTTNASIFRLYAREVTGTSGATYRVDIRNNTSTGTIYRTVGSTTTSIGTFSAPNSTDPERLRLRVEGGTINVRLWADGSPEPTTWTTSVTDTQVTGPGRSRLTYTASGGASTNVSVDDWRQLDLAAPPTPAASYSYDDADRIIGETLRSGGRTRAYTSGQLTGFDQTVPGAVRTTSRTYDSSGRIRTATTGTVTQTYSYDNAGQLLKIQPSSGSATTYTYDILGRRATVKVGSVAPTTYAYDSASQLQTVTPASGAATSYAYDNAGRRTSATTGTNVTSYGYDPAGRLSTLSLPDGSSQARAYDPSGRLATTTNTVGSTVTNLNYDWDGQQLLSWQDTVSTNFIGSQDDWAAINRGSKTLALGTDVYGSLTPSTGVTNVARASSYKEFGQPGSGTDTLAARVGYRGELYLSNLLQLRARDYDPAMGQFTMTDPLDGVDGAPTAANAYHYADNNPLQKVDPLGLRAQDCSMNGGSCTIVVDDKQVGRVTTHQRQGPPTGIDGLRQNHLDADSAAPNLAGLADEMLGFSGAAGVDIAVLYHIVKGEAHGRDGGIGDQIEDWIHYRGGAACDSGIPGACRLSGGRGLDSVSLGITNMQRAAYNAAKSRKCGLGSSSGAWTDLIGDPNYSVQMSAYFLATLDCAVMDYARAQPNKFKIHQIGEDSVDHECGQIATKSIGFVNLYDCDRGGNRLLSRNALDLFAYNAGLARAIDVMENRDISDVWPTWILKRHVAANRSTDVFGNLGDYPAFFCATPDTPYAC
jgi:RHS repeat-associated protein